MAKSREFRTGFDAGYVDPEYASRDDVELYRRSLTKCNNYEISYSGSIRKRRPLVRLTQTAGPFVSTDVGLRIEPFRFDENNTWIVEFDTAAGGTIQIRDLNANIVQTWTGLDFINATTIPELDYDQLLDTAVIAHQSFRQKLIRRNGATWSLEDFEYTFRGAVATPLYDKPWHKFQDNLNVYLKPSVWSGAGFMNAYVESGGVLVDYNLFDTDNALNEIWTWRGQQFLITATPSPPTNQADITVIEPFTRDVRLYLTEGIPTAADDFEVGEYVRGAQTGATGWVTAKDIGVNNSLDIEVEQGVFKAPTTDPGAVPDIDKSEELESLEDPTKRYYIQWKDNSPAPSASLDWAEPAWSDYRGYPETVAFRSGRLWFAGSTDLPNFIAGSRALDFFNFNVGSGSADDSIQYFIIEGGVSRIHHLVSAQHLCIFTDSAEYWVPETQTQPITPGSFAPRFATGFGSRRSLKPFLLEGDPIFAQQHGQVLRRFQYDARFKENYISPIISAWASSLIDSPVRALMHSGASERGEQHIYMVNGSSQMVKATLFPDGRLAYSTWTPAKYFPKDDQKDSAEFLWCMKSDADVFFIVQEGSLRFIDKVSAAYAGVPLLDEYKTYTSQNPTQTFTVDADFTGKDVRVVGWDEDKDLPVYDLGDFTVAGTTLDLFNPIWKKISVGYKYDSDATLVPVNAIAQDGNTRMLPKSLVSHAPVLIDTYSFQIGIRHYEATQPSPTVAPVPINGEPRSYVLGASTNIQLTLGSYKPLPCECAGISMEISF